MSHEGTIADILKVMPHRYPFLLIDRVVSMVLGDRITVIKNVTINEPFFNGHFPEKPVMPGVLILEAMAQATAYLAIKTFEDDAPSLTGNELFLFAGVDKARFKKPVLPGDQLIIEATLGRAKAGVMKSEATASVDDKIVCAASLLAAYRDIKL